MAGNAIQNIQQFESRLLKAADQLRVNSILTAGECVLPMLSVLRLQQEASR